MRRPNEAALVTAAMLAIAGMLLGLLAVGSLDVPGKDAVVYGMMLVFVGTVALHGYIIVRGDRDGKGMLSGGRFPLQDMLDHIPMGIVVVDARSRRPVFLNAPARQLVSVSLGRGDSIEPYAALQAFELENGEPYPASRLPLTVALESGRSTVRGDLYARLPDGRRVAVRTSAEAIRDREGNVDAVVVALEDVSESHAVEKAKGEFVSLASHQLRTPIASIRWYTEALIKGRRGDVTDAQREYLTIIAEASKRMTALINGLLNVSRIETDQLAVNPRPLSLPQVAEGVRTDLKPIAARRDVGIVIEASDGIPKIPLDEKLTRIAIENVVTNAVKYSDEGGTVTITVKDQGAYTAVTVSDTGCGIPKDEQHLIYNKLFRARNVRQFDTDGTGLGLYIARSVMRKMGGDIRFESDEGKGTDVTLLFTKEGAQPSSGVVTDLTPS